MISLNDCILNSISSKRAILAFNIQNILQLEAISRSSKVMNKPVIAQFSSKYIPYFEKMYRIDNLVNKYQRDLLFFHLDHCNDDALIKLCIDKGFASVMYDGSDKNVSINAANTNKYYKYANHKTLLEVEIGSIGGVEDGFGVDKSNYFEPKELLEFSRIAKFDLLALGIGNVHGKYKSLSAVRLDLLELSNDLIGKKTSSLTWRFWFNKKNDQKEYRSWGCKNKYFNIIEKSHITYFKGVFFITSKI